MLLRRRLGFENSISEPPVIPPRANAVAAIDRLIHQGNYPVGVVHGFIVRSMAPCHIFPRDPVPIDPVALPPNDCGLPGSPFIRADYVL